MLPAWIRTYEITPCADELGVDGRGEAGFGDECSAGHGLVCEGSELTLRSCRDRDSEEKKGDRISKFHFRYAHSGNWKSR